MQAPNCPSTVCRKKKTAFPPLNCVSSLVKNQLIYPYGTNFETQKYEFSNLLSSFSRVFPLNFHVNFRISMSVGHGVFQTTQVILCVVRVPNYQYRTRYVCVCGAQSCLTLCSFIRCSPPGSSVHGIFRRECWGGCHFLLQIILPTQGLKLHLLHLLHGQTDSLPPGKPWLRAERKVNDIY